MGEEVENHSLVLGVARRDDQMATDLQLACFSGDRVEVADAVQFGLLGGELQVRLAAHRDAQEEPHCVGRRGSLGHYTARSAGAERAESTACKSVGQRTCTLRVHSSLFTHPAAACVRKRDSQPWRV